MTKLAEPRLLPPDRTLIFVCCGLITGFSAGLPPGAQEGVAPPLLLAIGSAVATYTAYRCVGLVRLVGCTLAIAIVYGTVWNVAIIINDLPATLHVRLLRSAFVGATSGAATHFFVLALHNYALSSSVPIHKSWGRELVFSTIIYASCLTSPRALDSQWGLVPLLICFHVAALHVSIMCGLASAKKVAEKKKVSGTNGTVAK
jgi:hypothetical protein